MSEPAKAVASNTAGQGQGPGAGVARGPTTASPGAFRIGALNDPQRNRWLKFLVYGKPGTGKTTLLGSCADVEDMRDILYVSIEAGEMALEDNERIVNPEYIDVIRMTDIEQLHKLLEFMKVHCKVRDENNTLSLARLQAKVFGLVPDDMGQPGKDPWPQDAQLYEMVGRIRKYRTLIIDSLTEIEAKNLAKVMGLDNIKEFELGNIEVSGWAEFRQNNHTIQRLVRAFRDLPINLGLVCAESYMQDEKKVFHYAPALTGKLSQQVQGFVDVVGYMVISRAAAEEMKDPNPDSSNRRRLYVQPQAGIKFDAKTRRSGYKKAYFNDPTMTDMLQAWGMLKVTG